MGPVTAPDRTSSPLAPLIWFRIVFGALMTVESFGAIATGWVHSTFIEPNYTFPMIGFEWLRILAGPQIHAYFAVMGVAALGVTLGYRYRVSAFVLALMWSGAYLAQKTHYNNHYYLAALFAWWMAVLPAHHQRSLDVKAGRVRRYERASPWVLRLFRIQVLIVFVFAAIAKLYPGWLNGDYLRVNLGAKGDRWPLGWLVVEPWFQTFTKYAAILFDALVIPALMWKRTRFLAVLGLIGFDLFNSIVFRIGIFPYMVIGLIVFFYEDRFEGEGEGAGNGEVWRARWLPAAAVIYLAIQVLLPLRHHLIPGDVTWTEEGHRLSWRMMLRTKGGWVRLRAKSAAANESWVVPSRAILGSDEHARRIATHPEFLYQFVQILKEHYARERGIVDLEVYAEQSAVSLNGTPVRPLYDPGVDLARARWRPGLEHDPWVLPRRPE